MRWPVVGFIVGVIGAGLVFDSTLDDPGVASTEATPVAYPQAAPATALTSTWYCPTVRSALGGTVTLLLANPSDRMVTASIELVSPTAAPVVRSVNVQAFDVEAFSIDDSTSAALVAALVEAPGGELAVSRVVESELGIGAASCATEAAREWHLATGTTLVDAAEQLVIFNPFPDFATLDIRLATEAEDGVFFAPDLQGVVVPGRSVRLVDLTEAARRRDQIAMSLEVRTGRVVVDRVQVLDGSAGREGLWLDLAAAQPANAWYVPDGLVADGVEASLYVYNPTDRAAEIDVELQLPGALVQPLGLTVRPRDYLLVPIVTDIELDSLDAVLEAPLGARFAAVIRSFNDTPVVVELRQIVRSPATPVSTTTTTTTTVAPTTTTAAPTTTTAAPGDGTSNETSTTTTSTTTTTTTTTTAPPTTTTTTPSRFGDPFPAGRPDRGSDAVSGVPITSARWVVSTWANDASVARRLVLHNPSGEPRVVEVFRLAGGSLVAVDTVSLAPVSQMSITIEGQAGPVALLVEADGPIVAAQGGDLVGGLGVAIAIGVPLS